MRKILSSMRRAIQDYNMIADGDKIAVGVSGGKDSLALLLALSEFRRFAKVKFDVIGITINLGLDGMDFSAVERLCREKNIEYIEKKTDIAEILFDVRHEKNPCSLCSKMRKGALNELAIMHGCNKVALGHHREDVIETFFLSLFYEGRLNCFSPVTYLSRTDVYVIRPFIYTQEGDIKGFAQRNNVPVVKNSCPMDGASKRQDMKDFVHKCSENDHHFKTRMMHAIKTGLDDWKIGQEEE